MKQTTAMFAGYFGVLLWALYVKGNTFQDPCSFLEDGTRLPHPFECDHFIICKDEVIKSVRRCPRGLYFNRRLGVCDLKRRAQCVTSSDLRKIERMSEKSEYSCDCCSYCDCSDLVAGPDNSSTTAPAPGTSATVTDSSTCPAGNTCNKKGVCEDQQDGALFPDPASNGYILCECECEVPMSCPSGLKFNPLVEVCDWPSDSDSGLNPSSPSTGPSGTTCNKKGVCANQPDGAMFSHSGSNGYIVCQCECEIPMPCPSGLIFNPSLNVCDWPKLANTTTTTPSSSISTNTKEIPTMGTSTVSIDTSTTDTSLTSTDTTTMVDVYSTSSTSELSTTTNYPTPITSSTLAESSTTNITSASSDTSTTDTSLTSTASTDTTTTMVDVYSISSTTELSTGDTSTIDTSLTSTDTTTTVVNVYITSSTTELSTTTNYSTPITSSTLVESSTTSTTSASGDTSTIDTSLTSTDTTTTVVDVYSTSSTFELSTTTNYPTPITSSTLAESSTTNTTSTSSDTSTTDKSSGSTLTTQDSSSSSTSSELSSTSDSSAITPSTTTDKSTASRDTSTIVPFPTSTDSTSTPRDASTPSMISTPSNPSEGPSGTTCNKKGVCDNQPDGTMFRDPASNGYIVCQCECEIAMPCPSGLIFNPLMNVCDWPNDTTGSGSDAPSVPAPAPSDNVAPENPSSGPSGTTCNKKGICKSKPDGTMFADPYSNGYIVCQCECEIPMPCPNGLVFNTAVDVCYWPQVST